MSIQRNGISRMKLLVLAAAVAVIAAGCAAEAADDVAVTAADAEDSSPRFSVSVMELMPRTMVNSIRVNAEIEPVSTVDVFVETTGELTELNVSRNDRVSRDQVIGQVDPSRAGQRFAPSAIRAPISGTVVQISFRVGAQVSPQAPIARIATTDQLEILANVPERHVSSLRRGVRATVELDSFPGEQFPARITQLSPMVNPQTRTLETTLRFDRSDSRIRPGMFARVDIVVDERPNALVVPQSAIVRRDVRPFVYVLNDEDMAERRDVRTGLELDGNAEILEGLSTGDRVVVRGQNLLEPGARVRVVEEL
ncbi:MAG: efflux RND transporter periplasmic adaptor subunit [Spirochaetaceae bacterium]|nr:MAG: efflux RND transporter periplasmic adaptor subunit [Spirochaetaceae bacterium]